MFSELGLRNRNKIKKRHKQIFVEMEIKMFKKKVQKLSYDKEKKKPLIRCSICNGEQIAGFRDLVTGKFEEVMLLKNNADLKYFMELYGIDEPVAKEY